MNEVSYVNVQTMINFDAPVRSLRLDRGMQMGGYTLQIEVEGQSEEECREKIAAFRKAAAEALNG